jgi:redox-sensitive bicupin YhaK (pirin superfamily)
VLLVAATPINESVARGGPFVMNTKAEVMQAYDDFRNNRF